MFEKRSTPKMSKVKEVDSPEAGVIVKTAKDGCAEGLVYGGGGKEGIFIKEVVPESPASKSLKVKEGDQILSATVYFDNVSYEDAIQILEHAQAYKVKLCLKRKPDITETETAIESDAIPVIMGQNLISNISVAQQEEEIYSTEMREQGKTKRRGDARISWPKFPSFGKGRKSRFTRSHSSSEADEQRKLELSPTTSDTESPIKSQDALKGKKKHKIKLSALTKRGPISSSEDQDTDAPTTGQISSDIHQTQESDLLSPESLDGPSRETPEVYVTEDLKAEESLRPEQNIQTQIDTQTVQHKVELISIDSTLKTTDLTVALADQESPSGLKSPDGKKKKKEKSELKMKILGKDKSHKKDGKAKSSPKRLKTLGASIEKEDQPEKLELNTTLQVGQPAVDANNQIICSESPRVISSKSMIPQISLPKVELDISDVAFVRKHQQKGEEKTQKGKDTKQKQATKPGPTLKIPKIGPSDITTEEDIQIMNATVTTSKTEQFTTEGDKGKEGLSKSCVFTTQLPKREDIEIPGMEDMSMSATAKRFKEPKADFTGHYHEIQTETVQMSIDVDSVKQAVSKLPGYKLPQLDTSGMPIPEEVTVIDANAQRISVKTPTKVVAKHEADLTMFEMSASPEISKTTVKLPKITPVGLTSEELLSETKVDLKITKKEHETKLKDSHKDTETKPLKREDIIPLGKGTPQEATILQEHKCESEHELAATKESHKKSKKTKLTMPSFGITTPDIRIPDIGIDMPKQNISQKKDFKSKTETKKGKKQTGGIISDVKISEINTTENTEDESAAKKDGGLTVCDLTIDAKPMADIYFPEIKSEEKAVEAEEQSEKLLSGDKAIDIAEAGIKTLEKEGKGSKFKLPQLGISIPKVKGTRIDLSTANKNVAVTQVKGKAEVQLPGAPGMDVTLGSADVYIQEQKMEAEKPELEIKSPEFQGELDGQASKLKMPKFGIKIPKIKGSEFDVSLSKKDDDVKLPDATEEVQVPEAKPSEGYQTDFSLGRVDVSVPDQKMDVGQPEIGVKPLSVEGELDGHGSKLKMAKFGIKMPRIKGSEAELSLSSKDSDVKIQEAHVEVQIPKAPETDDSLGGAHASITEQKIDEEKTEMEIKALGTQVELQGQGSRFKMPKFGIKMPKFKGPELDLRLSKKDADDKLPQAKAQVQLQKTSETEVTPGNLDISVSEQKTEVEKPEMEIKSLHTEDEHDVHGGKFKMPKFGIKMPKIKGPEFDISLSKKDADVTLVETKDASIDVSMPEQKTEVEKAELGIESLQIEGEPDGQEHKFKMPKLGISVTKVKGPEVDLNLSQKDDDVSLPDLGMKQVGTAPKIAVQQDVEGSASKFKMTTFELSKLQTEGPKISGEIPDMDKDVKITIAGISVPEEEFSGGITGPSINVEGPSVDLKTTGPEIEAKGSKFKMPHLGFSMPKVKGPKIDLSLSKKEADFTLPEPKGDVKLPKIDLEKSDVSIQEVPVDIEKPELEMQALETKGQHDGQEEKIKMPKFGIKMPKVKGPEFHLGLSKKAVDITTPEAKADIDIPDAEPKAPSTKIEITAPESEIAADDTERSSSVLKMPNISFSMPKVKGPDINLNLPKRATDTTRPETEADVVFPEASEIEVSVGKAELMMQEGRAEAEKPEVQNKPLQAHVKIEGQGGRFKMPKLGIAKPKMKGPGTDLNLKDADVTLAEAKTEVKTPEDELKELSGKVEIKAPEIQDQLSVEQSPSKFKLPTFKFPKFRAAVSADTPDMEEIKVEESTFEMTKNEASVDVVAQNIDIEDQSLKVKMKYEVTEGEGKESKSKMPKFGISLPNIHGPGKDLSLSKKDANVKLPKGKADVQLPKVPECDVNLGKVDVSIPDVNIEIKKPDMKMELQQSKGGSDGKVIQFETPTLGKLESKVEGPQVDFGLSKTGIDITLPEAKAADLKDPSAIEDIKAAQIEPPSTSVKGSPSKFKLPTFKFPKFGVTTPNVIAEVPDTEKGFKIDGANIQASMPSADLTKVRAEVHMPEVEVKESLSNIVIEPQQDVDADAKLKKTKFSMPKFSFSKPSVKASGIDASFQNKNVEIPEGKMEVKGGLKIEMEAPEITMQKGATPEVDLSLSKKYEDVALPESEVKLPQIQLKKPFVEIDTKSSEIKVVTKDAEGSPSKFKMPTFKLPKFGLGPASSTVEVPALDKDAKIAGAHAQISEEVLTVTIAAPSTDIEGPSVDIKTAGAEYDGKGSKFKLPSLGLSMPEAKGSDLRLSMKDVDVTILEAKAEVKLLDADVKKPSSEKEIEAPEIKTLTKDTERSSLKFKMPTFKLPKFGVGTPSATLGESTMDKDVEIDGADIKIPEGARAVNSAAHCVDTEGLLIDVKITESEHEGKGSKFKLPSLGLSVPQGKGSDIDLCQTDVDVTLPDAKAEVDLPDVKLKTMSTEVEISAPEFKVITKDVEGSPSKFKMPTFKLPKFGLGTPSSTVEAPALDKDVKTGGAETDEVLTVNFTAPSIETEHPSVDLKTTKSEQEGKGSKLKFPSLGISGQQAKGPDVDLSLPKTDVDVTLPEVEAEVKLPDLKLKKPSIDVETKASEIKVDTKDAEGSPSKFKMPTFKLPKFGFGTPSSTIEVSALDKDVKTGGAETDEVLTVNTAATSIETTGPSVDFKTEGREHEGKGSKFKLPNLGFSVQQAKGPDVDLSLPKTDVDVTLPEVEAEVKLPDIKLKKPSIDVETKASEIKIDTKNVEGSPSKFKMPTFKLPKFGFGTPSSTVEVSALDKDVKTGGAETDEVLTVNIAATSIETTGPSVDYKTEGTEHEGKGSKLKLPSLGFSVQQAKGPDVDLSLPKTDVDVTLPEVEAEVKLPDIKLKKPSIDVETKASEIKIDTKNVEGSPSKFKMPTFKLPKFGLGTPSSTIEVSALDKDVKTGGAETDEVLTVTITAPSIETTGPSVDYKTEGTEHEGKGSKFKLPSLGFSVQQAKGPDVDLSLPKTDVDVTLPEAKVDVKLPDHELKKPAESEVHQVDFQASNVEGSPSKFKTPTFKLLKFGADTLQTSVEGPDMNKDVKADGAGLKVEETKTEVKPSDVEISFSVSDAPLIEGNVEAKKTSWTLPRFSFSKGNSKAPETDINLEDHITIPDTKTDLHPPDMDIKESSRTPIDGETVTDLDAKLKKPRFSLPRFSFSKQSTKEPEVDDSLSMCQVEGSQAEFEVKPPEIETGQESKFKMPKFGITMPKMKDLSMSKKDVDVTLPEIKAEVQHPDVGIKQPSAAVEINAPEIKAQPGNVELKSSKVKMPTITLPKFGAATPQLSVEVPAINKDKEIDAVPSIDTEGLSVVTKSKEGKPVDARLPETSAEVQLPNVAVKVDESVVSVPDVPAVEVEAALKRPYWTFPKISFSRTSGRAPDVDINIETPKLDVTSPEIKADVCLPDTDVKEPSGTMSVEESTAAELDTHLKKTKFSLPRFSFSKASIKEPSVPDVGVKDEPHEMEIKGPELEAGDDGQGPKAKGPEANLNLSQKDIDVKLPEDEVKDYSTGIEMTDSEIEAKSRDARRSSLKFKMPTLTMPKFGSASYDVTREANSEEKVDETDETKLKEDVTVIIKDPNTPYKIDVSKAAILDSETPKAETECVTHGSPSKFRLPSFKMPRLSFSKPKPEEEYVPVDSEHKEDQLEMKVDPRGETKSPKLSLTSFGEILKTIDVEFDVLKVDKDEQNLETLKEVHVTDEKHSEAKENETKSKQDTAKSPEKAGWFKFPKFGLSSPSEPANISVKGEQKDEKSPVGETWDEEMSPTCSVQSSDAFADISSTITSEHIGLSLSSPTKVTVKYTDPSAAAGLGEIHSDIVTSTTRTELISDVPDLPEKITILSSGVSSSSEDTIRLESGKIHVITSNIHATPETQHAKLLTALPIQSPGGQPLKSEAKEAASWTGGDLQSGKRTVFERHLLMETSSERSDSKETVVITKQITHIFGTPEPISGDTASSIQRLKDSVHSEKMRFFDEAEK
ncbi:uncharacterized protein [Leuresthes tenuis]|uniref:uncharacterized protein n=1 Tax=Leuresthes tenuis TaxID=355514 RepID=UPI003B50D3BE